MRLFEGSLGGHRHIRTHLWIDSLDPIEVVPRELDRRNLLVTDGLRLLERRKLVKFSHATAH
ncbi:hypothetical protein ACIBO2_11805 [Nonomuraea sp. NPDC050022]|uniref:hypothetical protein n=1 Tax=unclassified Nonomuraea TaxID=2593643 RepID=UPI0033D1A823